MMIVTEKDLIENARRLRSEEGDENYEYDRALVELVRDLTGQEYATVARRIDLRGESLRRTLAR